MKSILPPALMAASLLAGGCRTELLSPPDLVSSSGIIDFAAPHDMSGSGIDFAQGDQSVSSSCTTVAMWPTDQVVAMGTSMPAPGYDFESEIDAVRSLGDQTLDDLTAQVFFPTGSQVTFPISITFDDTVRYSTCNECLLIETDVGGNMGKNTLYLAQGGSMTVTQADETQNGSMAVNGTNVHLLEWNYDGMMNDQAVPGGRCYDVGSFAFSAMYSANGPSPPI